MRYLFKTLSANVYPLDIGFKLLAGLQGIVLLNGTEFDAQNWSARASSANLDDEFYAAVGRPERAIVRGHVQTYQEANNLKKR